MDPTTQNISNHMLGVPFLLVSNGTPTTKAFKAAGYEQIAKDYNVKLLDFDNCERIEKEWKYGKLKLPKILESHEYINVAKMKTHIQTIATLAMKNQKGLLSDLDKKQFHKSGKLPDMIKALNETIQPNLNIIDAIDCIEGNGPGGEGNLKTINKILTSTNIKAIDNAALQLMGIPVYKVKYMEKQDFEAVDEQPKNYKFKLPDEHYQKLNLKMWFNDSCSGCNHNIMASLKQLPKHPFKTIKFLYNITFNTTNIIAGPRHKSLPKKGKIICIGNCTTKLAKEKGCPYIAGCPPSIEKIVKEL